MRVVGTYSARRRWPGLVAALCSLIGCAAYQAQPLAPLDELLRAPTAKVVAEQASAIERPYLAPVIVDLRAPLDLNALAVIAVISNPDLKALRARAGVADAQVFAARLLPDPTFGIGFDHVLSGPDPLDAVMGQIAFDLSALRTHQVTLAGEEAAAQAVRLDLAWAEWQTAGQARLQAIRVVALRQARELSQHSATAAEHLLATSLRAAGRGDLRAEEVELRRIAALDSATQSRTNESALNTAQLELARLLGLPPVTALNLAPIPGTAPPIDAERLCAVAVNQRLDLQALQAGYTSQEAAVHKAVLDQFPNLALTLTRQRDNTGNQLFGPAVNFTLPLWNRNRGGIALALATRAALKAEYAARVLQTRAEISAAAAELAITRQQRTNLLSQLPDLERFAAASRTAAARGDLAQAVAETAAQAMRDKQLTFILLEQTVAEQLIALELLVGSPMENWQ